MSRVIRKRKIKRLPFITCYTDGSFSPSTKNGGWCAYLECNGSSAIISGYAKNTSISRMEITAVLEALDIVKEKSHFEIFSDSQYVVNTIAKKWIYIWKKNNWRNTSGKVANVDLWKKIYDLLQFHDVTISWVKGHSGVIGNELCDEIAQMNTKKLNNAFYSKRFI